MKFTPALFCLGVLAISATSASAKPAYVASTVNLRAAPGTTNEIVAKIPAGSLVDADNCTDGWCAVTWQDKSGFAIQTALDMSGRVPQRQAGPGPGGGYEVVPGPGGYVVEDGPVYYERPRPYYGYYGYGPYYGPRGYWRRRW
ncbi:MAG: SH3 domain-containing protein [Hyphomicrobiales bacterium]